MWHKPMMVIIGPLPHWGTQTRICERVLPRVSEVLVVYGFLTFCGREGLFY